MCVPISPQLAAHHDGIRRRCAATCWSHWHAEELYDIAETCQHTEPREAATRTESQLCGVSETGEAAKQRRQRRASGGPRGVAAASCFSRLYLIPILPDELEPSQAANHLIFWRPAARFDEFATTEGEDISPEQLKGLLLQLNGEESVRSLLVACCWRRLRRLRRRNRSPCRLRRLSRLSRLRHASTFAHISSGNRPSAPRPAALLTRVRLLVCR